MGDGAFDGWYGSEHPRLLRALLVIGGRGSDVAEVVDEAFVRAYERWDRVGRMTSPAGWTYRTALNLLRRRWRRASLEALLPLRATSGASEEAPSSDCDRTSVLRGTGG